MSPQWEEESPDHNSQMEPPPAPALSIRTFSLISLTPEAELSLLTHSYSTKSDTEVGDVKYGRPKLTNIFKKKNEQAHQVFLFIDFL